MSSLVAFLRRAAARGGLRSTVARDKHYGAGWHCALDHDEMEGHGTQNVLDLFEAAMWVDIMQDWLSVKATQNIAVLTTVG